MDFYKFYDEQKDYATYRSDSHKLEEYKIAIQWKVENLVKTLPGSLTFKNVLEVGCAMGILLKSIAERINIKNRFGVDISAENIEYAGKTYPDCSFVHGTIEELKEDWSAHFPVKKFDLTVLSDIIEHIPEDEKFLKEISEVSDYVLLNLPLEKCFNNRNRKYGESDPSGHLRNYNLPDAKRLVINSGFEIIAGFTDNAHFDESFFKNYSENRSSRVKAKAMPLRIYWTTFYAVEELIRKSLPELYKKKYGSNYFALLKSVKR